MTSPAAAVLPAPDPDGGDTVPPKGSDEAGDLPPKGSDETGDLPPPVRIRALPCWRGDVDIEPLPGGMTNRNFLVRDAGDAYVVRLGEDRPEHGIARWHELAVARAAFAAGISPEIVHAESGVMVSRHVAGHTLLPQDVREAHRLPALAELLRRCHRRMPRFLRGPALMFWVFHAVRNYAAQLAAWPDALFADRLAQLAVRADVLEAAVGPVDIVFAHNDLLAGNFIDDGERLWLIDWEYAGFNSPLFDLANLSANNGFDAEHDGELLGRYFGAAPTADRWRAFAAMRCASLLRESLWAAVSHHTSVVDFDYAGYGRTWLARFDEAWERFDTHGGAPR